MKQIPFFDTRAAFALRVRQLNQLLYEQMGGILKVCGLTVSPAETGALNVLFHAGPCSLADIAQAMGYSHQLTTKRVNLLVKREMAQLQNDPDDKRRRKVFLTDFGQQEAKLLQEFLPKLDRVYQNLFEEIGVDLHEQITIAEKALLACPMEKRVKNQC
jgi:DNA-binding MarR family transcriptional regulator